MDRNSFLIVLIIVLAILYINNMYETYVSSSYDITPSITTNMDWKGAMLSKYPYYTNNLITPPNDVLSKIKQLQTYQPKEDGYTNTSYVTTDMTKPELNNLTNREGFEEINESNEIEQFSMMNPYVPN